MTDKLSAQLMEAADRLDELSRSEIQVLLRRAALRLDGRMVPVGYVTLIPEASELVDEFAKEHDLNMDEAVNSILIDWGISAGMIEVDDLDDED